MRDKLIFYTFWTIVLAIVCVGGYIVAERLVDGFAALAKQLLGG